MSKNNQRNITRILVIRDNHNRLTRTIIDAYRRSDKANLIFFSRFAFAKRRDLDE